MTRTISPCTFGRRLRTVENHKVSSKLLNKHLQAYLPSLPQTHIPLLRRFSSQCIPSVTTNHTSYQIFQARLQTRLLYCTNVGPLMDQSFTYVVTTLMQRHAYIVLLYTPFSFFHALYPHFKMFSELSPSYFALRRCFWHGGPNHTSISKEAALRPSQRVVFTDIR